MEEVEATSLMTAEERSRYEEEKDARPLRNIATSVAFVMIMLGIFPSFVLFSTAGWVQLAQWSVSPDQVTQLVTPRTQMPFYAKFISALMGSLASIAILGPPRFQAKAEQQNTFSQFAAAMKPAYTAFLLGTMLWKVFQEYRTIACYVRGLEEFNNFRLDVAEDYLQVFPPLAVKTIEAWALVVGTGGNISSLVDILTLAMALHDRFNFIAVHDRDLVDHWCNKRQGLPKSTYSPFAGSPARIHTLIMTMAELNGTLYGVYVLCTCVFYIPYSFFFGCWGLISTALFYPWLFAAMFALAALMTKVIVVPLLLFKVSPNEVPHCEIEGNPPYTDNEMSGLKAAVRMVAHAQVGPAGLERKFPSVLFIGSRTFELESTALLAEYKKHLDTFLLTGITRDGWCYLVSLNVMFKFTFDLIPVLMSRFLSGEGYWASAVKTVSERHLSTYSGQFEKPVSLVWDFIMRTF